MGIRKNFDLTEIIARILEARSNPGSGVVAFRGFDIDNVLAVLETAVAFDPQIPEISRRALIFNAATEFAGKAKPDRAALTRSLDVAEAEYLSRPATPYVFVSSIGIRRINAAKQATIRGSRICLSASLPVKYDLSALPENIKAILRNTPNFLTNFCVHVRARDVVAAREQASFVSDLLRGMWNFTLNSAVAGRSSSGRTRPVNTILLGPVQTLHNADGTLATESLWYDELPLRGSWIYAASKKWTMLDKWERRVRQILREIPYRAEIENSFVRYVRACDFADHAVSFGRLWAVLEHLTGADGDYDKLVKRCIFLSHKSDREFDRLILEHLREVRNGLVHHDRSRSWMQTYLYQLKYYVEQVLLFHLKTGQRYASLQEAVHFLDHPTDDVLLRSRIAGMQHALRLHGKA